MNTCFNNIFKYLARAPKVLVIIGIGLVAMLWGTLPAHATESTSVKTDQIKVAYIANFVKFTTWNAEPQKNSSKPLQIMIIGNDDFLALLKQGFPNNQYNNRPVVFHTLHNMEQFDTFTDAQKLKIQQCHIVYLRKGRLTDIANLNKLTRKTPFLIIGELNDFAENGGMIGFRVSRSEINFEINSHIIQQSSVQVSSKLLRLGVQVKSKK